MSRLVLAIELGSRDRTPDGASPPLTADGWLALVAQAERAGVDFVTIADHHRPDSAHNAKRRRTGAPTGRLDAIMVACRLAPATRHIGLVPMASTTLTEPFLLSTQIATLDYASRGRGGWQIDVSDAPADALYVGPRLVPEPAARYLEAAEHAEVVRRLWDSWEDDAEIRDAVAQRFIDRGRVHYIDFAGEHFSVRGPSITPRPPQGQPVIVIAADRDEMRTLAASLADVAILATGDPDELESDTRAMRRAAEDARGGHADLCVLADVDVTLAATTTPDNVERRGLQLTGPVSDAADQLVAWAQSGVDGFRLRPMDLADDLAAIAGPLRAELRRRGVARTAYDQPTLRGMLGLPHPTSRYLVI
jgi:alkanesulfonate monooxygenase SsuD/methylene tetrahydromethanopterin reductase-like flavin-dependent oxidoreductase (luciferase family)